VSRPCNREACALRLERIAASAAILANDLRKHVWYDDARQQATQIHADAQYVQEQIDGDKAWEAGDR
jgi:hypothetical protein